ncbi:uncharacterized protein BDZ99DRAFT_133386 [Mytilinidion resinicola]|uniref:Uncharacterized protein n=1 Tax=Mytilinidion resinicola TaxID=574789 RepID=A0A6A6Z7R9_9PEZI|nr:uncharacterized protein BDZ99DRAFT_133386 [Mytilinidion resinicola]KAF2816315.1 hypothetical protein BDZ99DRAFT_133386 [Mytilinidion resinicola]
MRILPFRGGLATNATFKQQVRRAPKSSKSPVSPKPRMNWQTFDPTEGATNPKRDQRLKTLAKTLESARRKLETATPESLELDTHRLALVENRARFAEWYEPFERVYEDLSRLYEVLAKCPFPGLRQARARIRPGTELSRDILHLKMNLYPILEGLQSEKYRAYLKIRNDATPLFSLAIESSEFTEQAVRDLITQSPNENTLRDIFSNYPSFTIPSKGIARKLFVAEGKFDRALQTSLRKLSRDTHPVQTAWSIKHRMQSLTESASNKVDSESKQVSSSQIALWVQELQELERRKELQRPKHPPGLIRRISNRERDQQEALRVRISRLEQLLEELKGKMIDGPSLRSSLPAKVGANEVDKSLRKPKRKRPRKIGLTPSLRPPRPRLIATKSHKQESEHLDSGDSEKSNQSEPSFIPGFPHFHLR